jgi:predicted DNA repair protein MutK
MAGSSLLALIDDIASVLDDIAVMTKVAVKKTSGVLGDDLALNANQVAGVRADRELPVVWAVAKGSGKNKLILVPIAIGISAFMPWAVWPLLMLGGAYLCYEAVEKIVHKILHGKETRSAHNHARKAFADPNVDLVGIEKKKIQGAIRTDLILSAEIIVIALGTVKESSLTVQIVVVSGIAALMTVGVYGLVAIIVKLDDAGLYLIENRSVGHFGKFKNYLGSGLVRSAPYLMKLLSIVGTGAMFMVGGGIIVHGVPHSHDVIDYLEKQVRYWPATGGMLEPLISMSANVALGVIVGAIVLATTRLFTSVLKRLRAT